MSIERGGTKKIRGAEGCVSGQDFNPEQEMRRTQRNSSSDSFQEDEEAGDFVEKNCDLANLGLTTSCIKSFSVERTTSNVMNSAVHYTVNQNIHVQQFGDVMVEGVNNLAVGGTLNIATKSGPSQEEQEQEKTLTPTPAQRIRNRTESRIRAWIKGMVKTGALTEVLDRIHSGSTWVTIKGSPGEGKTTTAYTTALDEIHTEGRQVFQVTSPEEFSEVIMTSSKPVIMLDDILGDLEFDEAEWLIWKAVLKQFLDVKEHQSHQLGSQISETKGATVLLIGRDYVLNSASGIMGKLSDFVIDDQHVVELFGSLGRALQEKIDIWNAIIKENGIELDEDVILQVCEVRGTHGFPHMCRLFATMYQKNKTVSPEDFFKTPLEFLNQTVKNFMKNDIKLVLFEEMIKRGVKVSVRELGRLQHRSKIIEAADDLVGSYLRKEEDVFMFDHPSIYDSVAYNLCKVYPLFVIENCDLSFIHQRLRLGPAKDKGHGPSMSEVEVVVHIPRSYTRDLSERFAAEISTGNLFHVLSHKACADDQFIKELMSHIDIPLNDLLKLTDKKGHGDFLFLIASSKSPHLFKYVEEKAERKLSDSEMQTVLFGVCKYAASDAFSYLLRNYDNLNINARTSGEKQIPLMIAAESKDEKFLQQLMFLNPELDVTDAIDRTLLHYLCENGLVRSVEQVIDIGVDKEALDKFGQSPLSYACMRNQPDVAKLLLEKGAELTATSVGKACIAGNFKIVKLLFEKGTTVNMVSHHSACGSTNRDLINFLIEKGASVNEPGVMDMAPLHFGCVLDSPQVVGNLLRQGAVVDSRDKYGFTPLHKAAETGAKECIALLLRAGAYVNAQDEDSYTPLHEAVTNASTDCIDLLVQAGADANFRTKEGNTPLHEITDGQSDECVEVLLKAGADVNATDKTGHTLLHKIIHRTGVLNWLCLTDVSMCQSLVNHGAVVNKPDMEENTPLHLLCLVGSDTEIYEASYSSSSPAASYSEVYKTIVKLLISHGADVNKQNNKGEPALRGWCKTLITN